MATSSHQATKLHVSLSIIRNTSRRHLRRMDAAAAAWRGARLAGRERPKGNTDTRAGAVIQKHRYSFLDPTGMIPIRSQ